MANTLTLLPPNASPLERAASEAGAEIQRVPILLRQLWNPWDCPAPLLPYLAWAFSVDRWDTTWSDIAKRSVIASAFYVHRKKGTISALRRVVEPLGYLLEVVEWWETEPEGGRGTFALRIGVLDTGITDEMYTELERLIDDAKPLTRHLAGLSLVGSVSGATRVASATTSGVLTSVYPLQATNAEQTGVFSILAAEYTADTVSVFPQ